MCTVNDEDEEINLMETSNVMMDLLGSLCKKCSERASEVVLRGKDAYCRNCFLTYATHKFRAALGKSKLVRKGDKALVAFSGSSSTLTLLHLIKAGMDQEIHKRLMFEPVILYIDEGAAKGIPLDKRRARLEEIRNKLKQFDILSYYTTIDAVFKSSKDKLHYEVDSELPDESDSQIYNLFSAVNCPTAKQDLLQKLRNNLLLKIARIMGCNKILTGENLVDTASKLLTNISLGRGAQLPHDIGFCDSRQKGLMLLRPMQDFAREEIEFYNRVYGLEAVNNPLSLTEKETSKASIQMLTMAFVDELQQNFSATLSTVYRTGAKMSTTYDQSIESTDLCSLCMGPLDIIDVDESSSCNATEFSSLLSKHGATAIALETREAKFNESKSYENCGKQCTCSNQNGLEISHEEAFQFLCYSCRLIFKEMDSLQVVPKEILSSIKEKATLKRMRNEIEDFLI